MRTGDDRRRMLDAARLYVVAPAQISSGSLAHQIPALARSGVDIVQLRDRALDDYDLAHEAQACARAAEEAGILLIVNDSPELARRAATDGVHIGQSDGEVGEARRVLGPDRLVGRTTRGGEALRRAAEEGADYASVGPIWKTPTKPGRQPVGLAAAADGARAARLPWFAIGGIDARRALRLGAVGTERLAVVRAVTEAADPSAAARDLRRRLLGATPRVLAVSGSDSGGGAGMQADIKAISAAGGFPLSAVTALTAQTTLGVEEVVPAPIDFVARQIAVVEADLGVDAAKTGMLATGDLVEAVAAALAPLVADGAPLVVDTVLRAESGAALMADGGKEALARCLLPLATVITPNLIEAQTLAGDDRDDPEWLARALHARHGCAVIVTGGHGTSPDDVLVDDRGVSIVPGVRLPRATTHGAGCTHSATLATLLASGEPLRGAAIGAKRAATGAVRGGRPFGGGAGPVDVTNRRSGS